MSSQSMTASSYKLGNEFNNNNIGNNSIPNLNSNVINNSVNGNLDANVNNLNNTVNNAVNSYLDFKNNGYLYLIILILFLALIGINIFFIFGNVTEETIKQASPFMKGVYEFFGYTLETVGDVTVITAETAADGVKLGADVAAGTVKTGVNVLEKVGSVAMNDYYDKKENDQMVKDKKLLDNMKFKGNKDEVKSNESSNNIMYCKIAPGYCATVSDSSKCLSGNIFNSLEECKRM
tara:strand:+ start:158 stop:862 length:705 start_codon:yes stop_codon:yes gene_type:complete